MKSCCLRQIFSFGTVMFTVFCSSHSLAEGTDVVQNESIEVIGITPAHGTGLPVEMIDERLSSFKAKHNSREQGHRGNFKEQPIDSYAAELILQTWLSVRAGSQPD